MDIIFCYFDSPVCLSGHCFRMTDKNEHIFPKVTTETLILRIIRPESVVLIPLCELAFLLFVLSRYTEEERIKEESTSAGGREWMSDSPITAVRRRV